MADGSSGGMTGVLFEAGKTISDAGKKQAQQTAQSAFSSVTGSNKQLFNAKPQNNVFTPKPISPQGQGMPKLDPFANFGQAFEGGAAGKSPFGAKPPALPSLPQFSQADLDAMAAQNQASDSQAIAQKQAELEMIKTQAHKQRHDEVYYNAIKNVGEHSMEQNRKAQTQAEQQAAAQQAQDAQGQQMQNLPDSPLNKGQLTPPPNTAVQQARTVTEINRGTTG